MGNPPQKENRRAVDLQRRKVESLRRQVYALPDPSQSPPLSRALVDAEAELHRLEQQMPPEQAEEDDGLLLDTGGKGLKPGGILMGPGTTGIDAQVKLRMSHLPTGIAHLLDARHNPLLSYTIANGADDPVRLRLTSFVEGYSARAIDTVELFPGDSVDLPQLPTLFPERVRRINELTRATLQVRIDDLDGKTEQQSTFAIWLLARSSVYLRVRDPTTRRWIDLAKYLGAWVTPNAPAIMQLLRTAAELHPQRAIAGYQGKPEGVEEQVRAIYRAAQAAGIAYVNSVLTCGAGMGEALQRVRLPREAIENRSANCIDGTLLMASLLEAASLNPGIILVPGHAFLAWETWDDSGEWQYLETTMIGKYEFEAAKEAGCKLAERYRALFETSHDPRHFRLLSVLGLRDSGITPME